MDWMKWTKSLLTTLLLFSIVFFLYWVFKCIIAKEELDLVEVVLIYALADTTIRYYEKEE